MRQSVTERYFHLDRILLTEVRCFTVFVVLKLDVWNWSDILQFLCNIDGFLRI